MGPDQVQCEQRMAQVVQDAHEQDKIEPATQARDLIHRHVVKLDRQS